MGKVILENISKNHDAWVAQKRDLKYPTVGSGDIAAICGADDYCTVLRKWAIKTGKEEPDPVNDHMLFGQAMEPVIAQICERKLGLKLRYGDTLWAHDQYDWARATPDYICDSVNWIDVNAAIETLNEGSAPWTLNGMSDAIVEIKNVGFHSRDKWVPETPLAPRFQTIWQMGITGHHSAIIAPLIGGDIVGGFLPRYVAFDKAIFEQMLGLAEKFMWHVAKGVPPEPSKGDHKLVEDLIGPIDKGVSAMLDAKHADLIAEYKKLKERRTSVDAHSRELKAEGEFLQAKIRALMGSAAEAECGEYVLTAKNCDRKGYQAKAAKWVELNVELKNEVKK